MTATCAILIPVLDRPHRVAPLLASIEAARPPSGLARAVSPVFLVSRGDEAEIAAIRAMEPPSDYGAKIGFIFADWAPGPGDYARKMNLGIRRTQEPFVFLAADDLEFRPGWLENAIAEHLRSGACVVGTNDLGNPRVIDGNHSTHTLLHRDYAECGVIDEPGLVLHEGYFHNFVDQEFIETAKARGTYSHAPDAHIEHLHPHWGKGDVDATYQLAQNHFEADRAYYATRQHLWRQA